MRGVAREAAARRMLTLLAPLAVAVWPVDGASAQELNVWLDGNAVHARPPAGTMLDAARYGLAALRLHVSGRGSGGELGLSLGRGMEGGSGAWAGARMGAQASRVRGRVDGGVRAEASALHYLAPVRLANEVDYRHGIMQGTVSPWLGVSAGRWRLGAEGVYGGGAWRNELAWTVARPGPGPGPLPPVLPPVGGGTQRQTEEATGRTELAGGSVSLVRMLGPATLELRASGYDVSNVAVAGWYSGVDGTVQLSLGAVDVSAGGRRWQTPVEDAPVEVGGHLGLGVQAGPSAYMRITAARTVADLTYGAPSGTSVTAGVALRVGRRQLGPPVPARVGPAGTQGHTVTFTLQRRNARSVAVAGDFSGWEPRALRQASNGTWTLETVLPPGVYHYAFVVNGDTWLVPDHAQGIVDDGFGQRNATLVVNASQDR